MKEVFNVIYQVEKYAQLVTLYSNFSQHFVWMLYKMETGSAPFVIQVYF